MFTLNHQYGETSLLPVDWLARIASTIARFWSGSRQGRHVRLVSAELQALDDRMLKDIGLQRYRIERAVLNGGQAEWYAPAHRYGLVGGADTATHRSMPARS
jgi:uncharacterized protein YjiS (DUF1127 family)